MHECGCATVVELSWWQEERVKIREQEITFACVPAVHWSNRGVMDRNKVVFLFLIANNVTKLVCFFQ